MNYDEAIHAQVTREEARTEIARHYGEWDEFLVDCGDHATYSGGTVLGWLGY